MLCKRNKAHAKAKFTKCRSYLSPPGLTVVQVAQVENSQDQVGKVEILVQGLEAEQRTLSAALHKTWM